MGSDQSKLYNSSEEAEANREYWQRYGSSAENNCASRHMEESLRRLFELIKEDKKQGRSVAISYRNKQNLVTIGNGNKPAVNGKTIEDWKNNWYFDKTQKGQTLSDHTKGYMVDRVYVIDYDLFCMRKCDLDENTIQDLCWSRSIWCLYEAAMAKETISTMSDGIRIIDKLHMQSKTKGLSRKIFLIGWSKMMYDNNKAKMNKDILMEKFFNSVDWNKEMKNWCDNADPENIWRIMTSHKQDTCLQGELCRLERSGLQ